MFSIVHCLIIQIGTLSQKIVSQTPRMKEINLKNSLIDILLALIVGVLQFFTWAFITIYSFGFLICGNEYLTQWKSIRTGFIIGLIIFIFQVLFCRAFANHRTIILKISLWFVCFSAFIPISALGYETFYYSAYYEPFDSEKWKSMEPKPLSMVRNIYEDKTFIGSTRKGLIDKLGNGFESWVIDSNEIGYRTDGYASSLVFTLKNDTVTSYELWCND